MSACECGCGGEVPSGRRFIRGHNARTLHAARVENPRTHYTLKDGPLDTPCWIWRGGVNAGGYPQMGNGRTRVYVHRYVWEDEHGPIPPKLTIDHLCNTPDCINVEHMRLVTQAENARRGQIRRWHGVDIAIS